MRVRCGRQDRMSAPMMDDRRLRSREACPNSSMQQCALARALSKAFKCCLAGGRSSAIDDFSLDPRVTVMVRKQRNRAGFNIRMT